MTKDIFGNFKLTSKILFTFLRVYKTCYCDQLVTDAIKKIYVFARFNKLQMFRIFLEK